MAISPFRGILRRQRFFQRELVTPLAERTAELTAGVTDPLALGQAVIQAGREVTAEFQETMAARRARSRRGWRAAGAVAAIGAGVWGIGSLIAAGARRAGRGVVEVSGARAATAAELARVTAGEVGGAAAWLGLGGVRDVGGAFSRAAAAAAPAFAPAPWWRRAAAAIGGPAVAAPVAGAAAAPSLWSRFWGFATGDLPELILATGLATGAIGVGAGAAGAGIGWGVGQAIPDITITQGAPTVSALPSTMMAPAPGVMGAAAPGAINWDLMYLMA